MSTAPFAPVLHHVRALAGAGFDSLADRQLLDLFARQADGAAFAVIVRRHGPMVLGVCRRILRDGHAADDAFQATFLVLLRHARKLRQPELLGNWLYGVARRVARKARARADRQHIRERPVKEGLAVARESPAAEELCLLDDAIACLPEKYRTPLVLCCLDGLTQAQTAQHLRCPPATVATRVARAKAQLRVRLTRMGLAPAASAIAAGLSADALRAAVPMTLARATVAAATAVATGTVVGVPAPILTLTEGVGRAMMNQSWKAVFVAGAALGLAGAGAGVWSVGTAAGEPPGKPERNTVVAQPTAPERPDVTEADKPSTHRTANFLVTAPSERLAKTVGDVAEQARKDLAVEWLGREMPAWSSPCPLGVKVTAGGSGGATTLNFDFRGGYQVLSMQIEGRFEKLMRSTLRHEVAHTVLAHHFRQPVPRWADEGAASLAEAPEEAENLERGVRQVLDKNERIPLRRLFATRDYSEVTNVNVEFAEAYSIVRFLVERADKPTFLTFVRKGMTEGWDVAAKGCYGFDNVELLEAAWLESLRIRATKPTIETQPPNGENRYFEIPHDSMRPPASSNAHAAHGPLQPQIVAAWVDEDGKLAVRHHGTALVPVTGYRRDETGATVPVTTLTPTGHDSVRRYRLLDIRGFRFRKAALEEIELRTLAATLKHETPVVMITVPKPGDVPRSFDRLFFHVIKDDTIVLYLPPGDQNAPRPPAPPPLAVPAGFPSGRQ